MPFSTKSRQPFAHVAADPSREVFHSPAHFGQLVVVPPSLDVISPLVAQLLAGQALAGFPEFAHFGFQSLDTFRGGRDRPVLFQPKAEQCTFSGRSTTALLAVHRHFQVLFYPFRYTGQHTLRRSGTSNKDGYVVGVAHERQATAFQFLVQWVEVNVRQ